MSDNKKDPKLSLVLGGLANKEDRAQAQLDAYFDELIRRAVIIDTNSSSYSVYEHGKNETLEEDTCERGRLVALPNDEAARVTISCSMHAMPTTRNGCGMNITVPLDLQQVVQLQIMLDKFIKNQMLIKR